MTLRLFFSMAIAALAIAFALQNSAPVVVTFIAWRFESSLALVLVATLILGALIAALLSAAAAMRKNWKLAQQERLCGEHEKRIAELEQLVAARERRIAELETRKDQP